MTIPQLRLVAAKHVELARKYEDAANYAELTAQTRAATEARLEAEWHSNTAVHLAQFADGLAEGIRLLESLNLQPSSS
jgi:hypothetical protein